MPPLSARIKLTPRQSVVAEWRGQDLTEQEKAVARSAKPVSDFIPAVLKSIGLERKQSELEIVKVWNNLMDPLVAQHAKPSGIAKGTLFVSVDSNVWLDEIVAMINPKAIDQRRYRCRCRRLDFPIPGRR